MIFIIENKNIYYSDRIFKNRLRCIPRDEEMYKKVIMSRNQIPPKILEMFNLSEKDKLEYESANTEEELSTIIKKDCSEKGLKLISETKQ